jgi:hypothetical protein
VADQWKTAGIYPPEVLRRWASGAGTNVYMAAMSMAWALSPEPIPSRFKGLFQYCMAASPKARPLDAWDLQETWKHLAENEFGKPAYRKLELPVQ